VSGDGPGALWCAGIPARRYPIGSRTGNRRVIPNQASPKTPPLHRNRLASGVRRGTDKKNASKDAREPGWNPRHLVVLVLIGVGLVLFNLSNRSAMVI